MTPLDVAQAPSTEGRLRVLFVGPVPPFCSGIAQHGGHLADALAEHADVTVLSWQHQYPKLLFRHRQRDAAAAPHPSARFLLRWWDPSSWWRAGRVARRADIVVMAWTTPFHAVPYRFISRVGSPSRPVAIVHNAEPHERLPLQGPLTRWVLGNCRGLVTHASTVSEQLEQQGVDVETITTPMPPLVDVAPHPMPPVDPLRLLFFGFVRPYKGLDVALDALVLLRERGVRPQLSVVGEFWEDVEPWKRRLVDLDLTRQVDLHPGYLPDREIDALLAAHHALLVPYRTASQSGIVPIAMAAGRPVIATAVGGIAEVVKDDVNGTLAEPDDPASLAAAIERCADRLDDLAAHTQESLPTWDDVALAVLKVAGADRA